MAPRNKSRPTAVSAASFRRSGFSIRRTPSTSGNTRIVCYYKTTRGPARCLHEGPLWTNSLSRFFPDPQFYIPLKALEAGPSEISKQTSDAEGNYWLGTLRLGSASFQVAGFDRGPLEGYVKLPNNAIGKKEKKNQMHILRLI